MLAQSRNCWLTWRQRCFIGEKTLLGAVPSVPGGGTVRFVVSPADVAYDSDFVELENAGTPNLEAWLRMALFLCLPEKSLIKQEIVKPTLPEGSHLKTHAAVKKLTAALANPEAAKKSLAVLAILNRMTPHKALPALLRAITGTPKPAGFSKLFRAKPSEQLIHYSGKGSFLPSPVKTFSAPLYQVYADQPASGKSMPSIEAALELIEPILSHPEMRAMLINMAKASILNAHAADPTRYQVVEVANGSTSAFDLISRLLRDSAEKPKSVVFITEQEHHSNNLPWTQAGFEVVQLPLNDSLQVDWAAYQDKLKTYPADQFQRVFSFSASSNVSGMKTDLAAFDALKTENSDLVLGLDLAAYEAHHPFSFEDSPSVDFVCRSDHKLMGGPGSNGLLIAKSSLLTSLPPAFEDSQINALALLKSALAQAFQGHILGWDFIETHEKQNQVQFFAWAAKFNQNPHRAFDLEIYGSKKVKDRTPITAFNFLDKTTKDLGIHQHLVAQILSDWFGIQVRSGCNCAGPYGVRLFLGAESEARAANVKQIKDVVLTQGQGSQKPGWVRLDLGSLTPEELTYVQKSLSLIAEFSEQFKAQYIQNLSSGVWTLADSSPEKTSFKALLTEAMLTPDAMDLTAYRRFLNQHLVAVRQHLTSESTNTSST